MRRLQLRRFVAPLFPVTILLIGAFLPVSIPVADDFQTPSPNPLIKDGGTPRIVGPIHEGVSASQQFPAAGARIRSVALLLSTYGRTNRGTASITVQRDVGGQWQDLATRTASASMLENDTYYVVSFVPPLNIERSQRMRINLTTDGGPDDAISWWARTSQQPDRFLLMYDGHEQEGIAYFRVGYAPASGRLFQMLGPLWARVTVFLNPLWQVILVIGIGALVGMFVALGYMLTR